METKIDEIAPDIYRLSTWIEDVAPPAGFTFNQFVVRGEQPFLFHTGMRQLYPLVSDAVDRVVGRQHLRWISFGHVEADECGAMNQFLAAAPDARVVHGELACAISLNDLADRPPRPMGDEVLDLGGKQMRFIPTPHVPHNWESGVWFEETTRTLLAGDVMSTVGDGPAITSDDLVAAANACEDAFHSTSMGPDLIPTLHRLADLEPTTLAVMHGSSYHGDGAHQLRSLADSYDERLAAVLV
jgi:flavorubredoxin